MSRFSLSIFLDQTVYVTNRAISGTVYCLATDTGRLADVTMSLRVVEKCQDKEIVHHQSSQLIYSGVVTPSAENSAQPLFKVMKKGAEMFLPFRIPVPGDLPGTFDDPSAPGMSLLYVLETRARDVADNGATPVVATRVANVAENLSELHPEIVAIPCSAQSAKNFFFSSNGQLQMSVRTNKSVFAAGDQMLLSFDVKNESSKTVRGISVQLLRSDSSIERQPGTVVPKFVRVKPVKRAYRHYEGADFRVLPNHIRQMVVDFALPFSKPNQQSSSTPVSFVAGKMFSITFFLRVQLQTKWSKNLKVDIPIRIVNPASYFSIFFPTVEPTLMINNTPAPVEFDNNNAVVHWTEPSPPSATPASAPSAGYNDGGNCYNNVNMVDGSRQPPMYPSAYNATVA